MKKFTNYLSLLILCLSISMSFLTSCDKEEDEPKVMTDPAGYISGTYVGTGYLYDYLFGTTDEEYQGMKIVLTKSSYEFINVELYLANGNTFFSGSTPTTYQITQLASGAFMLTNSQVPEAKITVDKKGQVLDFYYPYVSKGEYNYYAIKFTGNKQY